MPNPRGAWVSLALTLEQAETLRVVLEACLHAGGDERIERIAIALRQAKIRQEMQALARRLEEGAADGSSGGKG